MYYGWQAIMFIKLSNTIAEFLEVQVYVPSFKFKKIIHLMLCSAQLAIITNYMMAMLNNSQSN